MPNKILDTAARRKITAAKDRATKRLIDRGWKFDGLWWTSPYSNKLRYHKREALNVEELREWAEGDSAYLNDKDHSMWVKKEIDDNALISMDELAEKWKAKDQVKNLALAGCYGK